MAARLKPNDLSATEEADNWELLLRECSLAGVVIDEQVRKLAQASLKRARAGSSGGGVDLRTLATAELTALLEQKELRRDAARHPVRAARDADAAGDLLGHPRA